MDVAPLIFIKFHTVGQSECLSNFIVMKQELKSNTFS